MPTKLDYLATYYPFRKSPPHVSYYPLITNVAAATLTATITWTTDLPSTSQVLYGVVPYLGFISTLDATYVTSHSITLSGLVVGKLYYFKVQSFNQDALSLSDLYTFVYTPVVGDLLLENGSGFILLEDGTKILVES